MENSPKTWGDSWHKEDQRFELHDYWGRAYLKRGCESKTGEYPAGTTFELCPNCVSEISKEKKS